MLLLAMLLEFIDPFGSLRSGLRRTRRRRDLAPTLPVIPRLLAPIFRFGGLLLAIRTYPVLAEFVDSLSVFAAVR